MKENSKLEKLPVIQTISGLLFNYNNPTFLIEDIAHSLSHQCRFSGHVKWFYSVAQHSLLVASLTKGDVLEALLHDADEAYLLDIPTPLKKILPDYSALQQNISKKMAEQFGIGYPFSHETEIADKKALVIEAFWLTAGVIPELLDTVPAEAIPSGKELFEHTPQKVTPKHVKHVFLNCFEQYKKIRTP